MTRSILLLIWLMALPLLASATHIVGGEIFYRCLGNDRYEVTLRVYRDCFTGQAPFDNPAIIGAYQNGSLFRAYNFTSPRITRIPAIINNPCLVVPPNVCVEEAEYRDTLTLPSGGGGYTLTYQRCCRNNTIINLQNPGDQGATYAIFVPDPPAGGCNSSPSFIDFPPIVICTGEPLNFDHSVSELDGDSIVYELCAPFLGGSQVDPAPNPPIRPPYSPVNYRAGFNASNPLTAAPTLSINPTTGLLSGTPTQTGQYVVGICVKEYRNGVLLSTLRRDFQFNVALCNRSTEAVIADAVDDTIRVCNDFTYNFTNRSRNATTYQWRFAIGTPAEDSSTAINPSFTFPDTGIYVVQLIANPGTPCSDTDEVLMVVFPGITADFTMDDGCRGDSIRFTNLSQTNYGVFSRFFWTFSNGNFSGDANPTTVYPTPGNFRVTLLAENEYGCQDFHIDTITVFPSPDPDFSIDGKCINQFLSLPNTSTISNGSIDQWRWYVEGDTVFGRDRDADVLFQQSGTYRIWLVATSDQGCSDSVFQEITIRPKPVATALGDTMVCPGEPVLLQSSGGLAYTWGPLGVPFSNPFDSVTLAYPVTNTTFIATVADDCYFDTAHIQVTMLPVPTVTARPDTFIYVGDTVHLWATSPDGSNFFWQPGDSLLFDNGNTVAAPVVTTTYTVTIDNAFGCPGIDTIRVLVYPICDELYFPNAFSPNGDGINDVFAPLDFGQSELVSFQVFNRMGQLLYATDDWQQGWDGTFGGKPQPIDSYAYLVRVRCNGRLTVIGGNMALLR